MPFHALLLVSPGRPFVSWWVDDPADPRIEIDICLPPTEIDPGWSFIDLELNPVRHERTSLVEIEDVDEFEDARERGWISTVDAELATRAAAQMKTALSERTEPWGDEGWRRLQGLRTRA